MNSIGDLVLAFFIAILSAYFSHLLTKNQLKDQFDHDFKVIKQNVIDELTKYKNEQKTEKLFSSANDLSECYLKNEYNNSGKTFFHTTEGKVRLDSINANIFLYGSSESKKILNKISSEINNKTNYDYYQAQMSKYRDELDEELKKGDCCNDDTCGELSYDFDYYENALKGLVEIFDDNNHYRKIRIYIAILLSQLMTELTGDIVKPIDFISSQLDFTYGNNFYNDNLDIVINEFGFKSEFRS